MRQNEKSNRQLKYSKHTICKSKMSRKLKFLASPLVLNSAKRTKQEGTKKSLEKKLRVMEDHYKETSTECYDEDDNIEDKSWKNEYPDPHQKTGSDRFCTK